MPALVLWRPGQTIVDIEEAGTHLDLWARGLARVYVAALDGRTMTVRYCRPGALIGAATLLATGGATVYPGAVSC